MEDQSTYPDRDLMATVEEVCIGCGVAPVVQVNDRSLCGNCFLLGISVSLQSTVSQAAELENIVKGQKADEAPIHELQSTLLTAIDEIQRLRMRLDQLATENSRLRESKQEE